MSMALAWKIFYGDGSTFTSADGSPYDAPRLGVQCIVGPDPDVGRYTVSDKDAYWWVEKAGRWTGGDRTGERLYMLRERHPVVLFGEWITDPEYNACIAAANADPDFPPKTAWDRGETRPLLAEAGG